MKLVILYGPPAVGKFTTGLELAAQTGFKLFHNHLTVDDANALFPEEGPQRKELLQKLRLDEITLAAKYGIDTIFTQAYSGAVDDPFMDTLVHTVEKYGGKVVFVRLKAPEETLLERVHGESRKHIFGKIVTTEGLQRRLRTHDHTSSVKHADNLIIDNSHLSPEETTQRIISHYKLEKIAPKTQQRDHKSPWKPSQKEVAEFLNTQIMGTIATLGPNGQPQAANVAFSQNDQLELLIGTSETSRKAKNIDRDARVAYEVTDPDKRYTVQFEGTARRLSAEEFSTREKAHFEKLPWSLPFKDIQGQVYILLQPSWVRFSDCSSYPWTLTEFHFKTD